MSDPWTVVTAIAAIVAAVTGVILIFFDRMNARVARQANALAAEAVRLQRAAVERQDEDRRRQEEAERPGLNITIQSSSAGMPLVTIDHIRSAPQPEWTIEQIRSNNPARALIQRSDSGMPSSQPPSATLPLHSRLPAGGALNVYPSRFFVLFAHKDDGAPVEIEIDVMRAARGAYSIPIEITQSGTIIVRDPRSAANAPVGSK